MILYSLHVLVNPIQWTVIIISSNSRSRSSSSSENHTKMAYINMFRIIDMHFRN